MTMREIIIAIGPNCWGSGTTEAEAVAHAKRVAPREYLGPGTYRIDVYRVIGFRYVNMIEGIVRDPKGATIKIDRRRMVIRK